METMNKQAEKIKEKALKQAQEVREKTTKRAEEEMRDKMRGNRTSVPPHVVHNSKGWARLPFRVNSGG